MSKDLKISGKGTTKPAALDRRTLQANQPVDPRECTYVLYHGNEAGQAIRIHNRACKNDLTAYME